MTADAAIAAAAVSFVFYRPSSEVIPLSLLVGRKTVARNYAGILFIIELHKLVTIEKPLLKKNEQRLL
jgi:hypothetical protein